MELFVKVMNVVNDIVWHPVMCVFLMFAALWFTFHLRGMQVRRFGDMLKCLTEKGDNKQDTGLSSFQAFATTVGGRVGTGNIATGPPIKIAVAVPAIFPVPTRPPTVVANA